MTSPIPSRAAEIRRDPVSNRWVIFSPARAKRPTDFKSKTPQNPNPNPDSSCPFCLGNEHHCAPEIFRVPPHDPEWKIRVIENLYPALSRNLGDGDPFVGTGDSGRFSINGIGFHDVVIESPVHSVQLSDLEASEIGDVLLAYKKRIEQIARCEYIQYAQVFKNHGASAGASMSHSHSQILALPIIPPTVSDRIDGTKEYFDQTGKCCLCEVQSKDLLIEETTYFISIAPFAATFPFEIWIIPRDHSPHFHELNLEKVPYLVVTSGVVRNEFSCQCGPTTNTGCSTSLLMNKLSAVGWSITAYLGMFMGKILEMRGKWLLVKNLIKMSFDEKKSSFCIDVVEDTILKGWHTAIIIKASWIELLATVVE